jgi:hypothetical protein
MRQMITLRPCLHNCAEQAYSTPLPEIGGGGRYPESEQEYRDYDQLCAIIYSHAAI